MSSAYKPRQQFNFTREEIAAELKRCGYPLASTEDIDKFERDLAALYTEGNLDASASASNDGTFSDKFYDLPLPTRDDIDFSKYYTRQENIKSVTSDCLRSSDGKTSGRFPLNFIKEAPQLSSPECSSAPSISRVVKDKSTSIGSTTKRKVLRRSDDGSSYIDELMYGSALPSIKQQNYKKCYLPLVNDGDSKRDHEFPSLSSTCGSELNHRQTLEDKISRLTLLSERSAASASPGSRRSLEAEDVRRSASPLRLSDRDNRQTNSAKLSTKMTDPSITSVIRPPPQLKGKQRSGLAVAQDPVTRYQEYSKAWRSQRAPGEKAHKELRWQIRGQMLAREGTVVSSGRRTLASSATATAPSQRPVSGRNDYVVPTEKKRQALRWTIRCALAAGRQPPSAARYVNKAFFSG